jgi:hypothetical protein
MLHIIRDIVKACRRYYCDKMAHYRGLRMTPSARSKLSLCLISKALLCHEDIRFEWSYSSTIFDLGTRWRWVVSFTPGRITSRYPLDMDLQIYVFLVSALVGGEWSAPRSGRFTAGERASDTHWIGGWVGPRTGLGDA